jgi:hypothetical protein
MTKTELRKQLELTDEEIQKACVCNEQGKGITCDDCGQGCDWVAKAAIDKVLNSKELGIKIESKLPIIEDGLFVPMVEDYGVEIRAVDEQNTIDNYLISEEEFQKCGDDEDLLIAQHNKSVTDLSKAGYTKFTPVSELED